MRKSILGILFFLIGAALVFASRGEIKVAHQEEFSLYAGNVGIGESIPVPTPTPDTEAPIVEVISPVNGSSVSGLVEVRAEASDSAGVAYVSFFVDGSSIGTDTSTPYSSLWDTTAYSNSLHNLFARAFDLAGNIGTSYSISVTVDNLAPSVSLTSPQAGSTVTGNVNLTSNASDNDSVTKVEYYVDGNFVGVGATSASFPYNWNSASVSDGNHSINAKAFDVANNTTTSVANSVTVDNNAPTVSVTSPANGSNVSGTVNVTADALDTVGVTFVEFYADGGLIATANSAPYSTSWDTTAYVHNTSHSLTAKANDRVGHVTTSSAVSVTVLDITSPNVNITNPMNGSTVDKGSRVTITANASDISSINKVEFYVNGVLKCTDTSSAYSCTWKVPSRKKVTYTLQAVGYDIAGNTSTSTVKVTSK